MKYLVFLALLLPGMAFAEVNLPLACPVAVVDGDCNSATYQLKPGVAGSYFATPSGIWKEWASLSPTDTVRVCPVEAAVNTQCPGARATVPKSQAFTAPEKTFTVTYSWGPPTKRTDDTPLETDDIKGYLLSWRLATDVAGWHDVSVGNVSNYTIDLPLANVCAVVRTVGAQANSPPTAEVCTAPKTAPPGMPSNVTVTFGNPGEPE